MKNQTIDAKLLFTQNAIEDALNVVKLSTALNAFGYNTTVARDQEIDILQVWMSDFVAIARIAMVLEVLGVVER